MDTDALDYQRLLTALQALKQTELSSGAARVLDLCIGPRVIDALLNEINQTVLRRRLEFSNDRGHTLCLEVSERRVFSIIECCLAGGDALRNLVLDPEDPEGILRLRSILGDFVNGVNEITVIAQPIETNNAVHSGGVSWEALRDADPEHAVPPSSDTEEVFEVELRCRVFAHASLYVSNGEEPRVWGQDSYRALLLELYEHQKELPAPLFADSGARAQIWCQPHTTELCTLNIEREGETLWALFIRSNLGQAAQFCTEQTRTSC